MTDTVIDQATAPIASDWTLVILAGGRGSRLGGQDKGLLTYQGEPAVLHLARRFAASRVLVSANRHEGRYRALGVAVVADQRAGFAGPLAGLEAALNQVVTAQAVVVPCDMPYLPVSLPQCLLAALQPATTLAVAHDGARLQPLCLALNVAACLPALAAYLDQGGTSVQGWLATQQTAICDFSDQRPAFVNINTEAEYRRATGASPG